MLIKPNAAIVSAYLSRCDEAEGRRLVRLLLSQLPDRLWKPWLDETLTEVQRRKATAGSPKQ